MKPFRGHPVIPDEECIALIRSGGAASEAAKKALYLQYRDGIRASITHLLNTRSPYRDGADDLLHDSFLVLVRKIEQGETPASSLVQFWRGISHHLLFNHVKKDHRVILVADDHIAFDSITLSPEDLYIENESRESLLRCFAHLPDRCQTILLMWMDNYTMAEITARLELSTEAMTRKVKYNCFKKIKDLVRSGHKLPLSRHIKEE